jgi:hypothetical protein
MNKILLLLWGSLLCAMNPNYWSFYDTIYLKKDYFAIYHIKYQEIYHKLKFRFTLHKNEGIVMHYNYDKFPYQNILYKGSLNSFTKRVVHFDSPNNPYFLVVFKDYSDKIATFEFFVFNPDLDVYIELNNTNLRNKKYVQNLPDNE